MPEKIVIPFVGDKVTRITKAGETIIELYERYIVIEFDFECEEKPEEEEGEWKSCPVSIYKSRTTMLKSAVFAVAIYYSQERELFCVNIEFTSDAISVVFPDQKAAESVYYQIKSWLTV